MLEWPACLKSWLPARVPEESAVTMKDRKFSGSFGGRDGRTRYEDDLFCSSRFELGSVPLALRPQQKHTFLSWRNSYLCTFISSSSWSNA